MVKGENLAIERKLSKPQKRIFVGLSQQRLEAIQAIQEVEDAEREQIEMLRVKYGLPEGEYKVRQNKGTGDLILYAVPQPSEDEEPTDAS